MKKRYKILIFVVVLWPIFFMVLQVFGIKYAKFILNRDVFPLVNKEIGVKISIDDLGISLARGYIFIEGLSVANPDGYDGDLLTIKKVEANIKLTALLRKEVYLSQLRFDDVNLNIISKQLEDVNIVDVSEKLNEWTTKLEKEKTHTGVGSSEELEYDAPQEFLKFTLEDLYLDIVLSFSHKASQPTNNYDFILNLFYEADNITNVNKKNCPLGRFKITGDSPSVDNNISVDIDGIIYSLINIAKPSFESNINIMNVDLTGTDDLTEQLGISTDNLGIKGFLLCEHGTYVQPDSYLDLLFNNPILIGKLKGCFGHSLELPEELPINVLVRGSFGEPKINLAYVIQKVVSKVAKTTLKKKYFPTLKKFFSSFKVKPANPKEKNKE